MTPAVETIVSGVGFPESPRWHDGHLWFSDMGLKAVFRVGDAGAEVYVHVAGRPSGLGWLPDGRLQVVSMRDRVVLREAAAGSAELEVVADLAYVTGGHANDMVVTPDGDAYVGNFGYDFHAGASPQPTVLTRVALEGGIRQVADELLFPNGMALDPTGQLLVVAESAANRLSAFRRRADGTLTDRRLLADLGEIVPDGICMDAEGSIWVASARTGEAVRITPDGRIADRIDSGAAGAYACALGGAEGRTLFICTAPTGDEAEAGRLCGGAVVTASVAVPGAGSP